MSSDGTYVVRAVDIGKRYVKYDDVPALLTRALRLGRGTRRSHLWAVRHLDLDVAQGETLGVIGRNGSGKTTTLRMLAGVTAPTEGTVSVRGRVAPLISVGVGFHQELSGRENVYLNGSVLGMTRREIDRLFDQIVSFAEIEEFVDTPVKFYSSGMWLRLGFSVAVAARPDILLVDEVLAVGDAAFQMKCFERMRELKSEGTSIIVVSHNLHAIRAHCSRTVVMHKGTTGFTGPTIEAISAYHELLDETHDEGTTYRTGGPPVRILRCELLGEDGNGTAHLHAGEEATLRIHARFDQRVERGSFVLVLSTDAGLPVYLDSNHQTDARRFEAGEEVLCDVKFRSLLPSGTYVVHGAVGWGDDREAVTNSRLVTFFVSGRPFVLGVADLHASFEVNRSRSRPLPASVSRDDAADDHGGRTR